MKKSDKRAIKKMALNMDKSLSSEFTRVFCRFPEDDDDIRVIEFSLGFAMGLVLEEDLYEVFAFVHGLHVLSVEEYGYESHCYYCPSANKFHE